MKLTFNKTYFLFFTILFLIETLIALFIKDGFIRHTFGDYLVVIMLYCFFKTILKTKPIYIAIVVLLTAFTIEFLQLTNLLELLHLENSTTAKLILGNTFHISDYIAYSLGIITVLIIDYKNKQL
ncbi:ribosomal maturation YjgA family protein [Ichthyenterobacterium magnum]|uniref:Uncharacterized protein DUF2809 n=1 Tax=Ichthyenterobacterium magnum TaxID=1230530 RepID=A0A420DUX7_9FLAO|nr:DUF2809 domain-containing protein [Ichthyenterobacterium magnum]RKE98124.1 uncharacterized protein DUF2809 [Ichthyenterobacterium magnum]